MSLVPSLLRAIVLVNGDALVLHAGQRPYVTTAAGQIDLPGAGMSSEAVSDVIAQLLPPDLQQALTQLGAVQHDLRDLADFPGELFHVLATNEGAGPGVEIRRQLAPKRPIAVASPTEREATPVQRRPSDRIEPLRPLVPVPSMTGPSSVRDSSASALARQVQEPDPLDRLLHAAFADGASALYLVSGIPPWVRIEDDLRAMHGVAALSAAQVDAMLARVPEAGVAAGEPAREWVWEFPELGRVRCTSFHDQRGRGLVLRSVPMRPLTTRQLGLSREVEAFATQDAGLVLVASSRGSTARTIVSALIDLINRTRRVHIVTIEREPAIVHDCEGSLISQRDAGRSPDRMLELARAALREEPDVLVLDSVQTSELMTLALDTAHNGRLVICGCRGDAPSGVVAELVGLYPLRERQATQRLLARTLVGIVTEPADARAGSPGEPGTHLTNTPEVSRLIADGKFSELG